jgi:hypothetical protein
MSYASEHYFLLYESLADCDWTCVYNQTCVDLAADSLNTVIN